MSEQTGATTMTTPADATTPTAADPLTPEQRKWIDVCTANTSPEKLRQLIMSLASAHVDLEARLAAAERAKADAEAKLAKMREAAQWLCINPPGVPVPGWVDELINNAVESEANAALGATDAGGGEREARC